MSVTRRLGPPSWPIVALTLCSWNALLAVLLGKDMNWDLLNYHFYNGYAALTGRLARDLAPAQVQTFFNPLMDVPLYLAIVSLPPVVVGAVYGFVQGLSGVAVWLIGREMLPIVDRARREWAALGLALLGGLGTINIGELGGGMGDTLVSIPVLLSVAVLLRSRQRLETGPTGHVVGWAALAGALSGVGAGLKMTSALYSAGVTVGCLFLVHALRRRALIAACFAAGAGATWLLSSGFWLWRMWTHFGDPLFPFIRIFYSRPEFAAFKVGPAPGLRSGVVRRAFLPLLWTSDRLVVGQLGFRDWRLSILYLLLAALAIRWVVGQWSHGSRLRTLPAGAMAFLLISGLCSYALWLFSFRVYRFLAPFEWLAPLAITLALMSLLPVRHRTLAIGAVLALIVLSTQLPDWGRAGWTRTYFLEDAPPLDASTSPMIVITGLNALSFVVPHLPSHVRVVRLQSNSFLYGRTLGGFYEDYGDGGPPNEFDKRVRRAIAFHSGSLYVMFDGPETSNKLSGAYDLDGVLGRARLRLHPETCRHVPIVEPSPPPWAVLRRQFTPHRAMPSAVMLCSVTRKPFDPKEYAADAAPLARLFFAYFNRAPDPAGLAEWVARHRAGMSLTAIADALASTDEFHAVYGSLTEEQFVTRAYRNLLGRDPDPAGLAYWCSQLAGRALTRGQLIWKIMESPEYRQAA